MNPIIHEPNPYNYPFPTRANLMSLSTINENQDFVNKNVKKFHSGRGWNNQLKVDDIDGARTKVPGYQYQNKPNLSNQNWDIDRTGPRALHIGLEKPEYNLTNDDIDRSKPKFQKFQTKRNVNPLNPSYSLPKAEIIPVDPPKFIRDNIANDDIDGAKPKKPKYFKTRDTMKLDDIEGTRTKPAPKRATSYSSFDYSDVTNHAFKSKRTTNPLNPSYFHKTEEGFVEKIGDIEGSKPKEAPVRKRGPNSMILNTEDIEGTKVGTKGLRAFKNYSRREYRNTNKVDDINGTQPGSLLKAPVTNRVVNPLNPIYPLLGAKELDGKFNEYAENVSKNANKPMTAPVKTRDSELKRLKVEKQPMLDKEAYKRDIASFYGTNPGFMQDVDFKQIKNACKPPKPEPAQKLVKAGDELNSEFKWDVKNFYGVPLSEKSEMSKDRHMFYRPGTVHAASRKELSTHENIEKFKSINTDSHRNTTTNLHIDQNKQHFKRDAAHFHGQSYKPSEAGSANGSIFQDNAAEFYGLAKPEDGEKPFKINKEDLKDPNNAKKTVSVLNERRLKNHEMNMQRHPMYGKNLRRFWGLKSYGKVISSNI